MWLAINLGIRFLLELCALAALGYWGFQWNQGTVVRIAVGLGAPLLAAVVWGIFVSPKASVTLPGLWPLLPEALVFGSAAAALYAAGQPAWCWILLAAAVVNKAVLLWLER